MDTLGRQSFYNQIINTAERRGKAEGTLPDTGDGTSFNVKMSKVSVASRNPFKRLFGMNSKQMQATITLSSGNMSMTNAVTLKSRDAKKGLQKEMEEKKKNFQALKYQQSAAAPRGQQFAARLGGQQFAPPQGYPPPAARPGYPPPAAAPRGQQFAPAQGYQQFAPPPRYPQAAAAPGGQQFAARPGGPPPVAVPASAQTTNATAAAGKAAQPAAATSTTGGTAPDAAALDGFKGKLEGLRGQADAAIFEKNSEHCSECLKQIKQTIADNRELWNGLNSFERADCLQKQAVLSCESSDLMGAIELFHEAKAAKESPEGQAAFDQLLPDKKEAWESEQSMLNTHIKQEIKALRSHGDPGLAAEAQQALDGTAPKTTTAAATSQSKPAATASASAQTTTAATGGAASKTTAAAASGTPSPLTATDLDDFKGKLADLREQAGTAIEGSRNDALGNIFQQIKETINGNSVFWKELSPMDRANCLQNQAELLGISRNGTPGDEDKKEIKKLLQEADTAQKSDQAAFNALQPNDQAEWHSKQAYYYGLIKSDAECRGLAEEHRKLANAANPKMAQPAAAATTGGTAPQAAAAAQSKPAATAPASAQTTTAAAGGAAAKPAVASQSTPAAAATAGTATAADAAAASGTPSFGATDLDDFKGKLAGLREQANEDMNGAYTISRSELLGQIKKTIDANQGFWNGLNSFEQADCLQTQANLLYQTYTHEGKDFTDLMGAIELFREAKAAKESQAGQAAFDKLTSEKQENWNLGNKGLSRNINRSIGGLRRENKSDLATKAQQALDGTAPKTTTAAAAPASAQTAAAAATAGTAATGTPSSSAAELEKFRGDLKLFYDLAANAKTNDTNRGNLCRFIKKEIDANPNLWNQFSSRERTRLLRSTANLFLKVGENSSAIALLKAAEAERNTPENQATWQSLNFLSHADHFQNYATLLIQAGDKDGALDLLKKVEEELQSGDGQAALNGLPVIGQMRFHGEQASLCEQAGDMTLAAQYRAAETSAQTAQNARTATATLKKNLESLLKQVVDAAAEHKPTEVIFAQMKEAIDTNPGPWSQLSSQERTEFLLSQISCEGSDVKALLQKLEEERSGAGKDDWQKLSFQDRKSYLLYQVKYFIKAGDNAGAKALLQKIETERTSGADQAAWQKLNFQDRSSYLRAQAGLFIQAGDKDGALELLKKVETERTSGAGKDAWQSLDFTGRRYYLQAQAGLFIQAGDKAGALELLQKVETERTSGTGKAAFEKLSPKDQASWHATQAILYGNAGDTESAKKHRALQAQAKAAGE
jgi:hypothetical protein